MLRVDCEAVSKVFGGHRALITVSAAFRGGEVTVLEGPNGAGKSTLLSLVGGFTRPSGGAVHWRLSERDELTREEARSAVGWVAHETLLYGDLTGRENLTLAGKLVDAPLVWDELTERFGLGGFLDRPVRICSRGQRQRVALARALLHEPEIVLLDEPSTGLDRESVARLVGVISAEAKRGAVVLCVTHDDVFAEQLGGGRLRLERGRLAGSELRA